MSIGPKIMRRILSVSKPSVSEATPIPSGHVQCPKCQAIRHRKAGDCKKIGECPMEKAIPA